MNYNDIKYDQINKGIFNAGATFSASGINYLLSGGKITAGQNIELYDFSFFNCQNGEMSAQKIFLPYRKNVNLENCKINGEVYYLDPDYEDIHHSSSDKYFEGGVKLTPGGSGFVIRTAGENAKVEVEHQDL